MFCCMKLAILKAGIQPFIMKRALSRKGCEEEVPEAMNRTNYYDDFFGLAKGNLNAIFITKVKKKHLEFYTNIDIRANVGKYDMNGSGYLDYE